VLGVAIVIGVVVVVVTGAMLTLALALRSATKEAGKQEARGDAYVVRLEVAVANGKNESARADFEKGRADALDAAIAKLAADAVGPVDGAFAELLQAASAARAGAAGRSGAGVVPDAGAPGGEAGADRDDPDGLLKPGE